MQDKKVLSSKEHSRQREQGPGVMERNRHRVSIQPSSNLCGGKRFLKEYFLLSVLPDNWLPGGGLGGFWGSGLRA